MRQDALNDATYEDSDHAPRVYGAHHAIVVELHGEIDVVAFQRSAPLLDAVTAGPEPLLVVDLTHVTFLDCSGLSLLMRAHRRMAAADGRLRLVCTRPLTLRMLSVTGLASVLAPAPTVEAALRDSRGDDGN